MDKLIKQIKLKVDDRHVHVPWRMDKKDGMAIQESRGRPLFGNGSFGFSFPDMRTVALL